MALALWSKSCIGFFVLFGKFSQMRVGEAEQSLSYSTCPAPVEKNHHAEQRGGVFMSPLLITQAVFGHRVSLVAFGCGARYCTPLYRAWGNLGQGRCPMGGAGV